MFLIQLKDTKPDVLKHGMISFTLLAESLRSFRDKSGKEEATLPTSSNAFDLPIIPRFE